MSNERSSNLKKAHTITSRTAKVMLPLLIVGTAILTGCSSKRSDAITQSQANVGAPSPTAADAQRLRDEVEQLCKTQSYDAVKAEFSDTLCAKVLDEVVPATMNSIDLKQFDAYRSVLGDMATYMKVVATSPDDTAQAARDTAAEAVLTRANSGDIAWKQRDKTKEGNLAYRVFNATELIVDRLSSQKRTYDLFSLERPVQSPGIIYDYAPQEPKIGMRSSEVQGIWGKPNLVNRTTTASGTIEQWVYSSHNAYLYFTDGVLTSVQNRVRP